MALSFLKKGGDAHRELENAEAQTELRRNSAGDPYKFRFWMKEGGPERKVTFLDGDLDENGLIDIVSFWEHQVEIGGDFNCFFPCIQTEEPCPICKEGKKPSLVSLLTVVDHSEYKGNDGKVYKDQKKLYVAKRDTVKQLQKQATKRKGLRGCVFEIGRTGDKSAKVGNEFEFVIKFSEGELESKVGDATPFNYEEVIQYKNRDDLSKLGFGVTTNTIGRESNTNLDDNVPF